MAYKGVYTYQLLQNPEKIIGCNPKKLVFRSLWERSLIEWCDANPQVVKWSLESEATTVKYMHPIRQKPSKYIIDFYIEFADGRQMLIEVKPNKETKQPQLTESKMTKTGKPTARFKRELETYQVNQEKWRVAKSFANQNGLEFFVWDEHTLDKLGVRRLSPAKSDDKVKKVLAMENKAWRKKPAKPKRPKSSYRKKTK